MKIIFQISLCITVILWTGSCSSDENDKKIENPINVLITAYTYNDSEVEVMQLINSYREHMGLNALIRVNHISFKAAEHCNYMIINKVVSHDNFAARSENVIRVLGAYKVGENVAYNYKTSAAVMKAWLESGEHKKNIEGDYTHFGIAVKMDAENGRKYYTNIFAKIER